MMEAAGFHCLGTGHCMARTLHVGLDLRIGIGLHVIDGSQVEEVINFPYNSFVKKNFCADFYR